MSQSTEELVGISASVVCIDGSARLHKSAGTRAVTSDEVIYRNYDSRARLPREPWLSLSEDAISTIGPRTRTSDFGTTVYVFQVGERAIDAARLLSTRQVAGSDSLRNRIRTQFENEMRKHCGIEGEAHYVGMQMNPPNLLSVTKDNDTGKFLGLHVDSWDGETISRRSRSRNRLSINIGQTARYFLFIPVLLEKVAAYMGIDGYLQCDLRTSLTPLARRFLSERPEVPVVRCRVGPGEAYVAPTENLIHDASSLGFTDVGKNFTILARIRPYPDKV